MAKDTLAKFSGKNDRDIRDQNWGDTKGKLSSLVSSALVKKILYFEQ